MLFQFGHLLDQLVVVGLSLHDLLVLGRHLGRELEDNLGGVVGLLFLLVSRLQALGTGVTFHLKGLIQLFLKRINSALVFNFLLLNGDLCELLRFSLGFNRLAKSLLEGCKLLLRILTLLSEPLSFLTEPCCFLGLGV
jgi:hypothetical protein